MTAFSVDSDAVLSASATVRGTVDRLETESNTLMGQLATLQTTWTGAAAGGFHTVVDRWRATQREVEESLAAITAALATAGRQYADAEAAAAGLFR